ncbi:DUF3800 domain-containing protein [Curtobacterium oceanosedimentum]|uniref:DUF3800 domain-containing protein n=1 Tax=Curtobacterium oceanosedimentum TaxID=465820 RepID=UPI001AE8AFBD
MHTAYVDESEPGGGLAHTVYVMAAVLVADDRTDELRAAVRMTTPERMRKLHWYEALLSQRLTWIGLLAHAISVVVVRYGGAPARAERRRRRCIERLIWELEQRDVPSVVIESRGRARDAGDVSMLESLRDRGVGRSVRYEHVRGVDEPLLALADIACGAHARGLLPTRSDDVLVVVH